MIIDAAELKRRYVQRIAGVRDKKAYIGPEIVTLELTNACNIRCQFCYADHSPGNPAHFDKAHYFPREKFFRIIRDCVDLNVDQITILGTGEPTIHPSFRDMMQHLENQPVYVKLFTNATFSLEYCSDVIKVDHVIVNLSSVDRQQYLDLQGKDLFDRVVANIERLVSLRDTSKPGFKIEIAYIVNSVNFNQIQKMKELAFQLGVNSVYFQKMREHVYNQKIALPKNLMSELAEVEKRNVPASLNGWFYVLVTSDGYFYNCYQISQIRYGDFDKWSLKQFWLSPHMMKIRLLRKYGHVQGIDRKFG